MSTKRYVLSRPSDGSRVYFYAAESGEAKWSLHIMQADRFTRSGAAQAVRQLGAQFAGVRVERL